MNRNILFFVGAVVLAVIVFVGLKFLPSTPPPPVAIVPNPAPVATTSTVSPFGTKTVACVATTTPYLTYRNEQYGFAFEYPSEYGVQEIFRNDNASSPSLYLFVCPEVGRNQAVSMGINFNLQVIEGLRLNITKKTTYSLNGNQFTQIETESPGGADANIFIRNPGKNYIFQVAGGASQTALLERIAKSLTFF